MTHLPARPSQSTAEALDRQRAPDEIRAAFATARLVLRG
jgi:hypothetical protein